MKFVQENIKPILALLTQVLGFAYFFLCTFTEIDADPQIIIAIVAAMSTTLQYYFGSSTGAAKKDETINNLTENKK